MPFKRSPGGPSGKGSNPRAENFFRYPAVSEDVGHSLAILAFFVY